LPQFKGRENAVNHQFPVFSQINDDDTVLLKYAQCNNCGLIHKVVDICKSEILEGRENFGSLMSIDDIKMSIPSNLVNILERHSVDLPRWELAQFLFENKLWGNFVVLASEDDGSSKHGKYVKIMSETLFKVENFSREDVAMLKE